MSTRRCLVCNKDLKREYHCTIPMGPAHWLKREPSCVSCLWNAKRKLGPARNLQFSIDFYDASGKHMFSSRTSPCQAQFTTQESDYAMSFDAYRGAK